MRKNILIGLSIGVASLLFSGCAKESEQVYLQYPITQTSKSFNSFVVEEPPRCPNYSEKQIHSHLRQVEYIKSINIQTKDDGTQTTNREIATIDEGRQLIFSWCKTVDGVYSFKFTDEVTDLKAIEKLVL